MLVERALAALAIGSVLCGVCGGGPPAHATLVEISGSGTWSASTPTTPESAPGESFSYSFDIPNPYTGTVFDNPPQGLETTQATNLVYDLNGSPVSVGIAVMVFFNSSFGGLFELVLTDLNTFAAFGPDIGSTGTIETGTFSAVYGMNAVTAPNPPQASGEVLVGPVTPSVPEPSAAALAATGILALALIRRRYPGS